jgi:cellulose biosynthesis protein BcsQ
MKSVVFFNNKGGVGKTTLTANVAAYLNMHFEIRVLLIDADPQCNATQLLLPEDMLEDLYFEQKSTYKTLYSALSPLNKGEPQIDASLSVIPRSASEYSTSLIPGDPRMSLIEDRLSRAWSELLGADRIGGFRVTNWLSQLYEPLKNKYDLVVFDVGPSLGALNRTVLLSSDYVVTPFGSDIFSLLGIKNIADWLDNWSSDYRSAIKDILTKDKDVLAEYPGVIDISEKFRFGGYSVQQYVTRTFKEGRRPVRAYDEIMKLIPSTISKSMKPFTQGTEDPAKLELGHIPFLYSLVPLSQSRKMPIHRLIEARAVTGAQVKNASDYGKIIHNFCTQLLSNIDLK